MTKPKPFAAAQLVKVADLLPYEANARTHSAAQVEQIKASFRQFGFVGVLAYDAKGLAIGHGRQIALLEMWAAGEIVMGPGKREPLPEGLAPAIDITGLSDAERRALIIADNKLALNAGWDEEILARELAALGEIGFEMPVIGFDSRELAKLMKGSGSRTDPDDVPEPPAVPVTRKGDIWLLGRHRLICGSCTDADDVAAVHADLAPSLTLTDPPYGIGYAYKDHDDNDPEANAQLVAAAFALGPAGKVWTPGAMNLSRDVARFGRARTLCWHKGFAQAGNGLGGASTWEPVLVIDPPLKALPNDYLDFSTDRAELRGKMLREFHPCPKPVALFAHLIEAFLPADGVAYEPFSGSGTTILAGEQTGRAVVATEIDPAYVDVAVERWEAFTGEDARLEATGQTLAIVRAERITS